MSEISVINEWLRDKLFEEKRNMFQLELPPLRCRRNPLRHSNIPATVGGSPKLYPIILNNYSITSSSTPYASPLHFKGIPFSWEKIPGIRKYEDSHKKSTSARSLLPLPPAGNSVSAATTKTDPFLVALVECSKDEDHLDHVWKSTSSKNFITRTLRDRFGFISMYGSCKRGCAVSESAIVYLPRSAAPHYLFNRRSS